MPRGAQAINDLVLREGREAAETILDGLIAGRFDQNQDLWPVANKLKGYQSWSIKSQQLVRQDAADFGGLLTSAPAKRRFDMTLVKQADGKWAVGTFSGPKPD